MTISLFRHFRTRASQNCRFYQLTMARQRFFHVNTSSGFPGRVQLGMGKNGIFLKNGNKPGSFKIKIQNLFANICLLKSMKPSWIFSHLYLLIFNYKVRTLKFQNGFFMVEFSHAMSQSRQSC